MSHDDELFIYVVVSVAADSRCNDFYRVEALCLTPERAVECRREILSHAPGYYRRIFISINKANCLDVQVFDEDNAL